MATEKQGKPREVKDTVTKEEVSKARAVLASEIEIDPRTKTDRVYPRDKYGQRISLDGEDVVLPNISGVVDNLPGLTKPQYDSHRLEYIGPVAAGVAVVEHQPLEPILLDEPEKPEAKPVAKTKDKEKVTM